MLCTVGKYRCVQNDAWIVVDTTQLSNCDKQYSTIISEFDCPLPTPEQVSSTSSATLSPEFVTGLSQYFQLSMLAYALIIFCAFYFVAANFFKR